MHKFAKDVEPEQDFGEKWYIWLMICAVYQKQFCPTRPMIFWFHTGSFFPSARKPFCSSGANCAMAVS